MNRKEFLRKGLISAGAVTGIAAVSKLSGESDPKTEQITGFNHIPPLAPEKMSNVIIHRASSRGHANYGWLDTHHTFSFSQYYNPERMHFGVLRVLNDDIVTGGRGFGTHPHDNMEIISIPLKGDLEHKDSMGNVQVIRENDIQVMSAGSGITHSEYNRNSESDVNFLQIWIYPNQKNVTPRYGQLALDPSKMQNRLQQILSPSQDDDGVWIHQDAWFHMGNFSKNNSAEYKLKKSGNGIYIFVLEGEVIAGDTTLGKRDGMGIWETNNIVLKANTDAQILIMEVPMNKA
jgi:redox-sensitive bicupin YhaK (pirin superfamily)